MRTDFKEYINIVKFLGEALGNNFEVVLYSMEDIKNPVIAAQNYEFEQDGTDFPGTGLLLDIIGSVELKKKDYLCSYESGSTPEERNKTSVFYIKNEQGEIEGLLCIYEKNSKVVQVKDVMDYMMTEETFSENEPQNYIGAEVEQILKSQITEVWNRYTKDKEKLSRKEKIAFIGELHEKGLFSIRGSVMQISKITGFSIASIYRYLSVVIED